MKPCNGSSVKVGPRPCGPGGPCRRPCRGGNREPIRFFNWPKAGNARKPLTRGSVCRLPCAADSGRPAGQPGRSAVTGRGVQSRAARENLREIGRACPSFVRQGLALALPWNRGSTTVSCRARALDRHATFVPFSPPDRRARTRSTRSCATLESGWLSTGPRVRRFEAEFAAYIGAPHAVAAELVHRGAAPVAARVGRRAGPRGDHDAADVLRDGQRHRARRRHAGLRRHRSARPGIWIRAAAADAITPRTRAILPVHYAGRPADIAGVRRDSRARTGWR